MSSEFWVKNCTKLDYNIKGPNGIKYRVEAGESADLVKRTQGRMSVEDFENDQTLSNIISRGEFLRLSGPSKNSDADDPDILQTAADVIEGDLGQSVVMENQVPLDKPSSEEDNETSTVGVVSNDGSTTVMNPVGEKVEAQQELDRVGNVVNQNGVSFVSPPDDFEATSLDLSPEESTKLSNSIKKVKRTIEERSQEKIANAKELNRIRLDKSRCSKITGSGKQCMNPKLDGSKFCSHPKHRD